MTVLQLIYASRPFGFDDLALSGILSSARANNTRDGITGALICREDLYLQLLEGDPNPVKEAFARIARDDRHADVTKLWDRSSNTRLFADWAMRHDPARSWMWTREQVSAGMATKSSADDVLAIFDRLSKEPPVKNQL